jgi:hypothetical protein
LKVLVFIVKTTVFFKKKGPGLSNQTLPQEYTDMAM